MYAFERSTNKQICLFCAHLRLYSVQSGLLMCYSSLYILIAVRSCLLRWILTIWLYHNWPELDIAGKTCLKVTVSWRKWRVKFAKIHGQIATWLNFHPHLQFPSTYLLRNKEAYVRKSKAKAFELQVFVGPA